MEDLLVVKHFVRTCLSMFYVSSFKLVLETTYRPNNYNNSYFMKFSVVCITVVFQVTWSCGCGWSELYNTITKQSSGKRPINSETVCAIIGCKKTGKKVYQTQFLQKTVNCNIGVKKHELWHTSKTAQAQNKILHNLHIVGALL